MPTKQTIRVIDSHTGGEPTRVVIAGGPELGHGSLAERKARFRDSFDTFRSAVVNEPRGSDVMVGALLCPPVDSSCVAGVIFFNNVGYLGMCGHGTIGVAVTLAHIKKISPGIHKLETPVGIVEFTLHDEHRVTIENVPSYRYAKQVPLQLPDGQTIHGDVAWGGNWFFLVNDHDKQLSLEQVDALTAYTWTIRQELARQGITGADHAEIDHVELFGPPETDHADSRNFVLCPGKAYDRSPCGTGTSAKLACLHADGKLAEGQVWRQASIIGSIFEGRVQRRGEDIIPWITGSAYVCGESTLIIDPADPFSMGIRS